MKTTEDRPAFEVDLRVAKIQVSEIALLTLAAIFGLLIVSYGAMLDAKEDLTKFFSILILSIGGSVVAASLVGVLLHLYGSTGQRRSRKQLRYFLGLSADTDKAIIVIPRFPTNTSTIRSASETPGESKELRCRHVIKDGRLTNRYTLAFDDIAAARHITTAFLACGLRPPRIEFDDDIWKLMFGGKGEKHSAYIVIGLYSNSISMELANRDAVDDQRLFSLSNSQEFYKNRRALSICPQTRESSASWRANESKHWNCEIKVDLNLPVDDLELQPDFALVAKCFSPMGRPILILGGAKSRATRKAASLFRKSWPALLRQSDLTGTDVAGSGAFAAAYHLDGKPDSGLEPAGFCLQKN